MQKLQQLPSWFAKQKLSGKLAIGCAGLLMLCCFCSIPVVIFSPSSSTPQVQKILIEETPSLVQTQSVEEINPSATSNLTNTPELTNTSELTDTPLPPTLTPDPNLFKPGTYLVGVDMYPGIYKGLAGSGLLSSCYWARLKDLSGGFDAIIANDNSIGQYYVEIRDTDYAFETHCEIVYLPVLSVSTGEFPNKIQPGMYLVGRDIMIGTYKGQAGSEVTSSCYWARLSNVAGGFDAIIANDNAVGQFYVQVAASDFALSTSCELARVGD